MARYQISHGVAQDFVSRPLASSVPEMKWEHTFLQMFCGTCEQLRSHFLLMLVGLHVGLPECRNGLHDSRLIPDVVAEGDPRAVPNSKDSPGASGSALCEGERHWKAEERERRQEPVVEFASASPTSTDEPSTPPPQPAFKQNHVLWLDRFQHSSCNRNAIATVLRTMADHCDDASVSFNNLQLRRCVLYTVFERSSACERRPLNRGKSHNGSTCRPRSLSSNSSRLGASKAFCKSNVQCHRPWDIWTDIFSSSCSCSCSCFRCCCSPCSYSPIRQNKFDTH